MSYFRKLLPGFLPMMSGSSSRYRLASAQVTQKNKEVMLLVTQRPRARLDLLEQFVYFGEHGGVELAERYLSAVETTCAGFPAVKEIRTAQFRAGLVARGLFAAEYAAIDFLKRTGGGAIDRGENPREVVLYD